MCKLHTLHLVTETIRKCYPKIDALMAHTKQCFSILLKVIENFIDNALAYLNLRKYFLHVGEHGYSQHLIILNIFNNLHTVRNNYKVTVRLVEKLQNTSVLLVESLQTVDDVYKRVKQSKKRLCYGNLLQCFKQILRQISSDSGSMDSLRNFKDYFNWATMISLVVERLFPLYKIIILITYSQLLITLL